MTLNLHENADSSEDDVDDEEAEKDEEKKIKIADNFLVCFLHHNFCGVLKLSLVLFLCLTQLLVESQY